MDTWLYGSIRSTRAIDLHSRTVYMSTRGTARAGRRVSNYNPADEINRFQLIGGGPDTSDGIANDYGLDGPGSNPGGGRDFPPVQTGPGAHPATM